jgi:UrcA family protein
MKTFFVSAAAALSISAAAPAFAETNSVAVDYSDLNVGSVKGQEVLARRIAQAARQSCKVGGSRDLGTLTREKQCMDVAMKSAQTQLAAAGIGLSVAVR